MDRKVVRDPSRLNPALRIKTDAVIRDVTAHLPKGYRLGYYETWRDPAQQAALVAAGVSKTLHSKHSHMPADAADLQFQRWTLLKGWRFVGWNETPAEWIAWLDSAKRAHGVLNPRLTWDHPHCEIV